MSHARFNPHPASLPGDALTSSAVSQDMSVSIRTRHRCRVMRWRSMAAARSRSSFNPHPASLPGDALSRILASACRTVSIRTRHRCRVMHAGRIHTAAPGRFQSAPGIAAG